MRSGKHARDTRKVTNGNLTFDEREAARRLGVSYITLFRRRKAGQVPFYRIGSRVLYDDACLVELLQKNRKSAAA